MTVQDELSTLGLKVGLQGVQHERSGCSKRFPDYVTIILRNTRYKKNGRVLCLLVRQMSQNTQTRINQTNERLSNGRRSQINLYEGRTEGSISLAPASIRQSSIRSAFSTSFSAKMFIYTNWLKDPMLDPVLLKG